MAFKTRIGQTVAIGHGAMTATRLIWWFSCLLVLGPLAVVAEYAVWLAWPAQRQATEQILPETLTIAVIALFTLLLVQLLLIPGAAAVFTGPRNTTRDRIRMLAHSRTARWCATSGVLTIALLFAARFPFGILRPFVIIVLSLALIWAMMRSGQGLNYVYRANRAAPYFSGMTEEEKKIVDQPWPEGSKPSFPLPDGLESAADARRYARRAKAISEVHVWTGAALIVIFSAFVGTSFSAMWESADPALWLPVYLVLGALALGFWIQRRARSYDSLREKFEARAIDLEAEKRPPSALARIWTALGLERRTARAPRSRLFSRRSRGDRLESDPSERPGLPDADRTTARRSAL